MRCDICGTLRGFPTQRADGVVRCKVCYLRNEEGGLEGAFGTKQSLRVRAQGRHPLEE